MQYTLKVSFLPRLARGQLLNIGAAMDNYLRAFDMESGYAG